MATDPRVISPDTATEPPVERAAPTPANYSARIGATCMMWAMGIGLGVFVVMAIFWGLTTGIPSLK